MIDKLVAMLSGAGNFSWVVFCRHARGGFVVRADDAERVRSVVRDLEERCAVDGARLFVDEVRPNGSGRVKLELAYCEGRWVNASETA